jgi:hypothetical protein
VPFTKTQVDRILTPVRPSRIESTRGQSYVPQYEVRAELSRVFGPGNWDSHIHDLTLLYEDDYEKDGKTYWKVCYRAACTLTIKDYEGNPICQYTEYHAEESAPQPSRGEAHALAVTSVESYALRRAAINLGDTFGLHLYKDGQITGLVKGSLMLTDPDSPLYSPSATPPPTADSGPLTEEQRQVLANSLGAQEIEQGEGYADAAPSAQ